MNDNAEKTDSYVTKSDNDLASDPHDGKHFRRQFANSAGTCNDFIDLKFPDNDSTGSRSPPARPTSFYSRYRIDS